ncbi:unnamed protein product, partial [Dovyalis caffra]
KINKGGQLSMKESGEKDKNECHGGDSRFMAMTLKRGRKKKALEYLLKKEESTVKAMVDLKKKYA